MIHTASFYEEWNFGKGRLVSIALDVPDWFANHYDSREVAIIEILQPTWHLINSRKARIMSPDQYEKIYFNLIKERVSGNWYDLENGRLGPKKTLQLFGVKDGDTLLCWEKHGYFCHRKLVADLLRKNGIDVVRK
ncbi:hypothetical protein ES705_21966 [subsurface metagenome]